MAAPHQVTCIIPDSDDADRRIDSIGGASGSESNGPWCIKLDVAIQGIKDGKWAFWTMAGPSRADVIIAKRNGREYLKTTVDYVEPDNLLALPRCR